MKISVVFYLLDALELRNLHRLNNAIGMKDSAKRVKACYKENTVEFNDARVRYQHAQGLYENAHAALFDIRELQKALRGENNENCRDK